MTDVVNNQQLEWWAAWIVATVLDGRATRRDLPPAPPATHDFDVCLSDRVVALEVTRAAVREVRAQQAAIDSASWEAPGLTHNWTLQVAAAGSGDPGAHVGTIAGKAPALLAVLERHDVARFDPAYKPSRPGDLFGAVRKLRDIGVLGGSAVTDAVEQAGNDNIAKLAKTGAAERHLFIWADRSDHATEGTLALGRLPTKPPSLSVGIDVVWVAAWAPRVAYHCYASTLWRATPRVAGRRSSRRTCSATSSGSPATVPLVGLKTQPPTRFGASCPHTAWICGDGFGYRMVDLEQLRHQPRDRITNADRYGNALGATRSSRTSATPNRRAIAEYALGPAVSGPSPGQHGSPCPVLSDGRHPDRD
ncbi:MAG: hypothetical protein ACYCXA_09470 [Actinomycetes bacterium]